MATYFFSADNGRRLFGFAYDVSWTSLHGSVERLRLMTDSWKSRIESDARLLPADGPGTSGLSGPDRPRARVVPFFIQSSVVVVRCHRLVCLGVSSLFIRSFASFPPHCFLTHVVLLTSPLSPLPHPLRHTRPHSHARLSVVPVSSHHLLMFTPPFITDFIVTSPVKGTEWVNGQTYAVTWTKGLLDGVDFVDLELLRMSKDGLILVARNSASSQSIKKPSLIIY